MNNIKKLCSNQRIATAFMILSIILLSFFTCKDVLNFYFNNEDVLCIQQGRFQSFKDIYNIVTKQYLSGQPGNLYRPLVILSCGIDYSLWKLNSFGYFLTNIFFHILVSISVFFLARLLTGGSKLISWLSAIIFTIHPIASFTAGWMITARGDTLAALFLIWSIILFIKYFSVVSHKGFFLISSVFLYILAFCSKEIAIILPLLIFTYLLIFSDEVITTVRVKQAIKKATPFFLITLILILWRAYIIKSLKGGFGLPEGFQNIIFEYFVYVIAPFGFPKLHSPALQIFLPLLIPIVLCLMLYKQMSTRGSKLLMFGLILTIIVIIVYFFMEQLIQRLPENNHYGIDLRFINKTIEGRDITWWKSYLGNIKGVFLNGLFTIIFFFLICLSGIIRYNKRKYFFPITYNGKLTLLLLVWFLLPLSVYLYALNLSNWYLYIPLIQFSILISFIFINSLQCIESSFFKRIATLTIMSVLIFSFLLNSPFRSIKGFKTDMKTATMFLDKVLETVHELPNDTTIYTIDNVPQNILSMSDHGIKTWLDLVYPSNKVKAIFLNRVPAVKPTPDYLDFEIQIVDNTNTVIKVTPRMNVKK
ncbi:hypothetical protein C4544_04755 [candidate division WS5 bacterium]|uniref:Glycosyltransferase RgtA/B/C/D-like domain-containing protein n=1 Tax=candidate division WS5 bacterium TaxID=2093353 RepID=A0A419DC09_9BACT|nr:MAG: hypothetical protein C4544_04755 [candidate division WS5 bacterium]